MKRWLLHFGLPICVGLFMGFCLRWTWIQCLTLPLSLVMFAHWLSRRTGGDAFEALDSPKVALLLTSSLLVVSWLAFWLWERPYDSGYRGLEGPEPGPKPIPALGWGHPRIVSYILALAPGSLYIAERAGRRISALLSKTPSA
jgi:hypothetical protein